MNRGLYISVAAALAVANLKAGTVSWGSYTGLKSVDSTYYFCLVKPGTTNGIISLPIVLAEACLEATNGFPWGSLYDVSGAAQASTNPLGTAAWTATSAYDPSGAALAATNGYPWGGLYDASGAANKATNLLGTAAWTAASAYDVSGAATNNSTLVRTPSTASVTFANTISAPTNSASLNTILNPVTALGQIYTFPAYRCFWTCSVTVTNKSTAIFSNCTTHIGFPVGAVGATNSTLPFVFSTMVNPSDKWCVTNAQTVGVLVGTNTVTIF